MEPLGESSEISGPAEQLQGNSGLPSQIQKLKEQKDFMPYQLEYQQTLNPSTAA